FSMGHSVEVASLDDPADRTLDDYPLPLHRLGPGISAWNYSPGLLPWIRRNHARYDSVIVDGIWQYYCYATWKALKGTDTPYFVFPHGMLDPWFKETYQLKHLKKLLFWHWCEFRLLRDARAVLFTCEEEKILARKSFSRYSAHELVVPFGTASPELNPTDYRLIFLEHHPELKGKMILLFMSRLHEKKGCDQLIQAFSQIAGQYPELVLCIAGAGESGYTSYLHRLSSDCEFRDRIIWLGMLQGDRKWQALSAANIFCLPSHQENFGIVVAEALSCETPVLTTNKVNIYREIIAAGCGVVTNDTSDDIYRGLSDLLCMSPSQLREMSIRGRQLFETTFTVQAMANGLISAIQGSH
ncbi:glycosyltransferase, partial [Aquabacterium sp.]|uniref:glycosyltransferase n=1 Tax=Aquabacterium sp. TaxID=1872578 RepID=UPI0035B4AB47